jgi:diguanylate cyclase (GGDEF)-like protein
MGVPETIEPTRLLAPSGKSELMAGLSRLLEGLEQRDDRADLIDAVLSAALSTERRIARQRERIAYLERLAVTDELTGLLNRRGFVAQLGRTLDAARRYDECGILIYVDLDGFKPINDGHGHAAGDAVLRILGRLLMDNVRTTDFVGRLGGDEFGVLLTRSRSVDGLGRAQVLDRVINRAKVTWGGATIRVRASLGFLAFGPDDDAETLLGRVDSMMYRTKRLRTEVTAARATA